GNLIGNTSGSQPTLANKQAGVLLTAGAQLNYVGLGGLAMAQAQSTTVSINPRATYLRTNNDNALDAVPINLAALGIQPGDLIALEELGDWSFAISSPETATSLGGVFSSSNVLLASSIQNRGPAPVAASRALFPGPTFSGGLPTAIPQDFPTG